MSSSSSLTSATLDSLYIRINPDNNKIRNQVKLQWVASDTSITNFRIYRGVSYFIGSTRTYDWTPVVDWIRTEGTNEYEIIIDISKGSVPEFVISPIDGSSSSSLTDGIPDVITNPSFVGLTTEEIRKIQLK